MYVAMDTDLCSHWGAGDYEWPMGPLAATRTAEAGGRYGSGSPPPAMGVRGITPGKFWKFYMPNRAF